MTHSRQEFLQLETEATGPQLDGIVTRDDSATHLHRHSDVGVWLTMPAPLNGWTVTEPCEYMLDAYGFVRLRGIVNGGVQTGGGLSVIFDWPSPGDVFWPATSLALWATPCIAFSGGFQYQPNALWQNGTELHFWGMSGNIFTPFRVDIGVVSYYPVGLP